MESNTDDKDSFRLTGRVITRYLDPETREYIPGSTMVEDNLLVDVAAVEIVKWLVNGTPKSAGAYKYMALGSSSTPATRSDVALSVEYSVGGYARQLATLTAVADGGYGNKIYQAVATFSAGSGRSAVYEFGMFDQLALGGSMFNHSVFTTSRDNLNNALEITYQCNASP